PAAFAAFAISVLSAATRARTAVLVLALTTVPGKYDDSPGNSGFFSGSTFLLRIRFPMSIDPYGVIISSALTPNIDISDDPGVPTSRVTPSRVLKYGVSKGSGIFITIICG